MIMLKEIRGNVKKSPKDNKNKESCLGGGKGAKKGDINYWPIRTRRNTDSTFLRFDSGFLSLLTQLTVNLLHSMKD